MLRYILGRILALLPVLLLISVSSFALIHLVPGDPAVIMAGLQAPDEVIQQVREAMRLNIPIHQQVYEWYKALVLHGDLGHSYFLNARVSAAILERMPLTLTVAVLAILLASIVGIGLGVLSAVHQNSGIDKLSMVLSLGGLSIPNFWLGLMLIMYFSVRLGLFPTGGYVPWSQDLLGSLRSLALPTFTLGFTAAALIMRTSRAAMIEVLTEDYVRTARAKGLRKLVVVNKHALKNALLPIVTVIGNTFGLLLGGAVVTETVFSLPGMGRLVALSILRRDYPLIQGALLTVGVLYVFVNLLVDVFYCLLDPRVKFD
jgi:peptide/nickel transport system permease protein